jgi:SAM-dependent methyltransferase
MTQITSGIRAILSHPKVYQTVQRIFGGSDSYYLELVSSRIMPFQGMKILDIGCGPAQVLGYLPAIEYWGFDISESYIQFARKKFGADGNFFCKKLDLVDLESMPKFDIVYASGLLHHLDDKEARLLMKLCHVALKPGGRVLTIDGVWVDGQNPFAKLFVKLDRGQNVRSEAGYRKIGSNDFDCKTEIVNKKWPPYNLCYMECIK